uniref:MADF domain-containing protein n=1 Tax=Strigamia maritima TaxID=126957 RepID=T1IHW9_STRMM
MASELDIGKFIEEKLWLKKIWRNLRDQFIKKKREYDLRKKHRPGLDEDWSPTWTHYNVLSFLDNPSQTRPTSDVDDENEGSEPSGSSMSTDSTAAEHQLLPTSTQTILTSPSRFPNSSNEDEVYHYTMGLQQRFRQLNPQMFHFLRIKIDTIILQLVLACKFLII